MNYICSSIQSPNDIRDHILDNQDYENTPPAILDYRAHLTITRDQGANGACLAFAASCMKEYQEMLNYNFKGYMSPQFIYDNRSNIQESGMYMRDVMRILQKIGSVPEHMCKYGEPAEQPYDDALLRAAANNRIKSYAKILTIETLKSSLLTNGPCLIAVPVYNYSNELWSQATGDTFKGGHAMVIVGYNLEGFIIRNSWGNSWGDNGYCIFPYTDWGKQWEVWTTIDEITSIAMTEHTTTDISEESSTWSVDVEVDSNTANNTSDESFIHAILRFVSQLFNMCTPFRLFR
tara:strand:+ start:817 stop:1689 length:873 start_codon:yes stop_codon:yes gene_type:complete